MLVQGAANVLKPNAILDHASVIIAIRYAIIPCNSRLNTAIHAQYVHFGDTAPHLPLTYPPYIADTRQFSACMDSVVTFPLDRNSPIVIYVGLQVKYRKEAHTGSRHAVTPPGPHASRRRISPPRRSRRCQNKATAPESPGLRPRGRRRTVRPLHPAAQPPGPASPRPAIPGYSQLPRYPFPVRATRFPCSPRQGIRRKLFNHCRVCARTAPDGADSCEIP